MKLYFSKGACSLVVRIIINELNLNCEYESVDLKTKRTESGKDFLTINPKGSVPVLMLDNNEILTENAVILQYLTEHAKASQLLPAKEHFAHYRVLEWLNFITTELHKSIGLLFNPSFTQDLKEKIFIPMIKNKITYVDHSLGKNHYLCGEEFTLPDAYLFVMVTWLNNFKFDLTTWPNLNRLFTELQKRKSILQSLQQEGFVHTTA